MPRIASFAAPLSPLIAMLQILPLARISASAAMSSTVGAPTESTTGETFSDLPVARANQLSGVKGPSAGSGALTQPPLR